MHIPTISHVPSLPSCCSTIVPQHVISAPSLSLFLFPSVVSVFNSLLAVIFVSCLWSDTVIMDMSIVLTYLHTVTVAASVLIESLKISALIIGWLCSCCRDVLYVIDNVIKASFAINNGFRTSLNLFCDIAKVCCVSCTALKLHSVSFNCTAAVLDLYPGSTYIALFDKTHAHMHRQLDQPQLRFSNRSPRPVESVWMLISRACVTRSTAKCGLNVEDSL